MADTIVFRERHLKIESLSLLCITVQGLALEDIQKNYRVSKHRGGVKESAMGFLLPKFPAENNDKPTSRIG